MVERDESLQDFLNAGKTAYLSRATEPDPAGSLNKIFATLETPAPYANASGGRLPVCHYLDEMADHSFSVLSRSALRDAPDEIQHVRTIDALIQSKPDLIVECAGHAAVRAYAEKVLDARIPLMVASVGALADRDLADVIFSSSRASGTSLILPSGAIGGLDLLRAVAANGLTHVKYIGSKPPAAWKGSPAEKQFPLDDLANRTVIFKGNGRKAALAFPKNANVVAALALASGSFDAINVELVADPSARGNTHHYSAASSICSFEMTIENLPSTGNASTSMTTVLSILQEIKKFSEQTRARPEDRSTNPWPSIWRHRKKLPPFNATVSCW